MDGAKHKTSSSEAEAPRVGLTHLHVLWIDPDKRTQDVVFLMSLQAPVQLLLLLGVQL